MAGMRIFWRLWPHEHRWRDFWSVGAIKARLNDPDFVQCGRCLAVTLKTHLWRAT